MVTTPPENLSSEEFKHYENGYLDATKDITYVLQQIILNAKTAEDVMLDVTSFVTGNITILDGGSLEEAMLVASLLESLK